MSLSQFVLFLHILVAIVGLGPTFAYGLIAATGRKDPAHMAFALRVTETIEKRLVIPLAVLLPLLGTWLIFLRDWDLWRSEWLVISIAIYIVAFGVAVLVLTPATGKLIRVLEGKPAPAAAGPAPGAAATASGPQGLPPEVARLAQVLQLGGIFEALAIASIVILMVWKPGAAFTT